MIALFDLTSYFPEIHGSERGLYDQIPGQVDEANEH
jgi:hypothetical protein